MLYNVVLVSAIYQHESATGTLLTPQETPLSVLSQEIPMVLGALC